MSLAVLRHHGHLDRSRHIAEVLGRHGLSYLLGALGLDRLSSLPRTLLGRARSAESHHTNPERLRLALEELGTTFIKLGQILSTRADLLPAEYLAELSKLQDSAPPVPWDEIRETVVAELGGSAEVAFLSFDPVPLAAASIGQAHAAVLRDGTEVVVKVRRPGVVEQVESDLEMLQNLAAAASRHWDFADSYDLVGLAQEFAETLRAELDYVREGHSAERFAANFRGDERVHIARVFWETTTSRVMTLERIRGAKVGDAGALEAEGIGPRELAERATGIILKMVFDDGFFHADPHPGNFFIEPEGRIGLIDFGMVGAVDERTRERLADLVLAITGQDSERLVDALLELGVARRRVEREPLRRDVDRLLTRYWGRPLGDLRVGALLDDAFAVMREHRLHLPADLALLLKALVMIEGVGARLDPGFRLVEALAPYTERLLLRRYSPSLLLRRMGRAGVELAGLGTEMPRVLRRIAGEIERGSLSVGVRPEEFGPVVNRLERLANRIVLGVIAAAFINGLAVLVSVYRPPGWERWAGAAFGFGLFCALALGAYLAVSILRPKRG